MPFSNTRWPLIALLLATLAIRGSVLWAMRDNLNQDPDAYRKIAENLLRHGEFAADNGPTAFRPPLYPVVLSNLPAPDGQQISLSKVAALHLLLGVATVWLTWLTARKVVPSLREGQVPQVTSASNQSSTNNSRSTAVPVAQGLSDLLSPLLAGFLIACDPILLNQQSLIMTETLAAYLAILSLWCLARFDGSRSCFNAALAGSAIGLAVLCRPTFLPWMGLVGAAILVVRGRNTECRMQNAEMGKPQRPWFADVGWRVANLLALGVAAAAVLSPWAIRNYQTFGKAFVTTTHGGYTLYLANNEYFYEYLSSGISFLPWDSSKFESKISSMEFHLANAVTHAIEDAQRVSDIDRVNYLSKRYLDHPEIYRDTLLSRMARSEVRRQPAKFARAAFYRLRQLWSPLPYKLTADESLSRRLLRYATCAWYCGVYVLAAVGIWRLRWKLVQSPWIWGVLLCLTFTAVHTFYWTNLRMRAPLMPFIALIASAALVPQIIRPKVQNLKSKN